MALCGGATLLRHRFVPADLCPPPPGCHRNRDCVKPKSDPRGGEGKWSLLRVGSACCKSVAANVAGKTAISINVNKGCSGVAGVHPGKGGRREEGMAFPV